MVRCMLIGAAVAAAGYSLGLEGWALWKFVIAIDLALLLVLTKDSQ